MAIAAANKDKFAFTGDGMKFQSGDPLVRAAMSPRTGRLVKLHDWLDNATPTTVREVLTKAWKYANHNDPTELAFVIALARLFSDAFPGEPIPIEVE